MYYLFWLAFSLFLISNKGFSQRIPKSLWIIFDPADSLCVNMVGNSFRFYNTEKSSHIGIWVLLMMLI
jgi:hypothetical protein